MIYADYCEDYNFVGTNFFLIAYETAERWDICRFSIFHCYDVNMSDLTEI